MDQRMKDKIKSGRLTSGDVCRLIDWQLSLRAEAIDSNLVLECLYFLYPNETGLAADRSETLLSRIRRAAFGRSRVHKARHHRRYSTRAILTAALLILLLASVAIAATLGIFKMLRENPSAEMSRQRLERLDETAVAVGTTAQLHAPAGGLDSIRLETDRDQISARQFARSFELTVDQVYCDGNKLYYSYMLTEPERSMRLGEGKPTGFDEWDWTWPGEAIAANPNWSPSMGEEQDAQAKAWMADPTKPRYVVYDTLGLGDGASLNDGTEKGIPLNIFDSADEWADAKTHVGFQQVDLPEDYVPGDTIEFILSVRYGTTVIYQDETGTYESSVRQEENRGVIWVPFTAEITGQPQEMTARAQFDDYAAEASVAISDVDISGRVLIDAPPEWILAFDDHAMQSDAIHSYTLVADGQRMPNVGGGHGVDRDTGKWVVHIRFDLPESAEHLTLIPDRIGVGEVPEEAIVLR